MFFNQLKLKARQSAISIFLQLFGSLLSGVLFLTHFIISIYLTILYHSMDETLYSLSITLYFVVWFICFLVMSCVLLQYFQNDIMNLLSREMHTRNTCTFIIVLFYYCICALVIIGIIPTVLPIITTLCSIYYYHSTFIMHQYGIKKEFFVCSIAYHLALMLPQFILQTIYYQKTTDYGNNIINVLYWINMLVFMFYVITVAIMIVINHSKLCHIYAAQSYLVQNQSKFFIITMVMECTLFFYHLFLLQLIELNTPLLFEELSATYIQTMAFLCINYFILSAPFSSIGIVNYYYNRSKTYTEIWRLCERHGYHSSTMFEYIYCVNHVCYHHMISDTYDKNTACSESMIILPKSQRMMKHWQGDRCCLKYQKQYMEQHNKKDQIALILNHFCHWTPWQRMVKWIRRKLPTTQCGFQNEITIGQWIGYVIINTKRVLLFVYCSSRLLSTFCGVIISNWFLFSHYIYVENQNIALNVMRIIGVFYTVVLSIWVYYAIRIYYFEYHVGYIIESQSIDIKDKTKCVQSFQYIMNINHLLSTYIRYEDIATIISLYVFYPDPSYQYT
eukprot:408881_1